MTSPKRDLSIPGEVVRDSKASEVLRAWVANGGLVCSLRPEIWEEPGYWGILLADVARHVANAVNDALVPFGVTITEIPLTPQVILRALGRI